MKTVKAHIEQGKDGSFGIYTEHGDLPFLVIGDGKTLSQAKDDFKAVWESSIQSYAERAGKTIEATYTYDWKVQGARQQQRTTELRTLYLNLQKG